MNDWPSHRLCLITRSTSPSPVLKKQPNSDVVRKKESITVNKERNKRRKGYGAVSKKYN